MPTPQHEPEGPVGPLDYTYSVSEDGTEVTFHQVALSSADEALTIRYDALAEVMAAMEKVQTVIKHHEDRTGGL